MPDFYFNTFRVFLFGSQGKLDEAKDTIERINYKENKECLQLHINITDKLKQSNQNYRKMIQNMFA